jgi:hypothetical protein
MQLGEPWWNDIDKETEEFRKKPVPFPLCPSQIPQELIWKQTRASCVEMLAMNHLRHGKA